MRTLCQPPSLTSSQAYGRDLHQNDLPMTEACLPIRARLLLVLSACAAFCSSGCHSIDLYDQSLHEPLQTVERPPREGEFISLPAYRIAPPDVISLEMLKQVPLPPYRTEANDILNIDVMGTLVGQPIGYTFRGNARVRVPYLIAPEGTVNLGPSYGKVRVIGMTIDEVKAAVTGHLAQILAHPIVSVSLAQSSGTQPITGQYPVGPDGTVNLGQYGAVHIAGKTVPEATLAIEEHLSRYFDSPEVSVKIAAYMSKVYYIITAGASLGDNIVRVPITGKETVLDAIAAIGGLSQLSSKEIWIARPTPASFGCEQILPVDYAAITRGASTQSNYQLMPGDRVFIADDGVLALTNTIGTITGPIERIAGVSSLIVSTIRGLNALGRNYNRR